MSTTANSKFKIMAGVLFASFIIMSLKFYAYWLTNSNSILTDALESIINVIAGSFALFSIYFSSMPKDENHPYGHGKIEFLSAGFEGALILIAGFSMIVKGSVELFNSHELTSLNIGTWIAGGAGLANYFIGRYLVKLGKKTSSATFIAEGKHLISDTISSVGLIIGLIIILLTEQYWIDNLLSIIFGGIILFTGFKLSKEAINNLLDEADQEKLESVSKLLNEKRKPEWIDIHNLRVIKYGSMLHVDCHITLPYYLSLTESHDHVSSLERMVKESHEGEIEFFIHADPCIPSLSCTICQLKTCAVREKPAAKKIEWNLENLLPNLKHHHKE